MERESVSEEILSKDVSPLTSNEKLEESPDKTSKSSKSNNPTP